MLSRNVKVMLLLLAVGLVYTFVLGCDDSVSSVGASLDAAGDAVVEDVKVAIKSVSKTDVRAAIKELEASNFGITTAAVGKKLADKYGDSYASYELLEAVKARCVKMGLTAQCTAKTQ